MRKGSYPVHFSHFTVELLVKSSFFKEQYQCFVMTRLVSISLEYITLCLMAGISVAAQESGNLYYY